MGVWGFDHDRLMGPYCCVNLAADVPTGWDEAAAAALVTGLPLVRSDPSASESREAIEGWARVCRDIPVGRICMGILPEGVPLRN